MNEWMNEWDERMQNQNETNGHRRTTLLPPQPNYLSFVLMVDTVDVVDAVDTNVLEDKEQSAQLVQDVHDISYLDVEPEEVYYDKKNFITTKLGNKISKKAILFGSDKICVLGKVRRKEEEEEEELVRMCVCVCVCVCSCMCMCVCVCVPQERKGMRNPTFLSSWFVLVLCIDYHRAQDGYSR